jgi:hypothetical protein
MEEATESILIPDLQHVAERIYQGTIDVASIRIWLRDPVL